MSITSETPVSSNLYPELKVAESVVERDAVRELVAQLADQVQQLETEYRSLYEDDPQRAHEIVKKVIRIADFLDTFGVQEDGEQTNPQFTGELDEEARGWPIGFPTKPATDEEIAAVVPIIPPDPDDPTDWQKDALCAQIDPIIFFPDRGEKSDTARSICNRCLAKSACSMYAFETNQQHGIWGGMTESERESVITRSNRYRR